MLYFISNFVYTVCRTGVALTKPLLFIRRGTSAAEVGFLVAYFAFAVVLTRFIIGVVSDKVGVKPILISAFILSGLIKIAYVTAPVYSFGVFSFLDGITHGCFMAVRGPILYSISDSQNRGSYFGKMTAFSNVAGFVASIAAGYLFESINETVFYFALAAVLICTGIVLFIFFKVPASVVLKKYSLFHKHIFSHISKLLIIVCLINFIQNIAMAPLWDCVMPLYITETLIMGSGIVGIVYSCDSIFSAAAALLLGKRADKCKATKLFAVCCALMLVLSLLICVLESKTIVLFAVFIVLGIVFSAASPVLEKIESTAIHETFTGFDYALISLSVGAGAAVGNALAGTFMSFYTPIYWLCITGIGNALIILLMFWVRKYSKD